MYRDYLLYNVRVYECGTKEWYLFDKLHRLDGPAVEFADGSKLWYKDGLRHRLDGPACEILDGEKAWYINGECYSEEDYKKEINNI